MTAPAPSSMTCAGLMKAAMSNWMSENAVAVRVVDVWVPRWGAHPNRSKRAA